MSSLPQLTPEVRSSSGMRKTTSRETIQTFEGYRHKRRISEKQFYDTKGVYGKDYPVMSTIPPRRFMTSGGSRVEVDNIEAMFSAGYFPGYAETNNDGVTASVQTGVRSVDIPSAKFITNPIADTNYCTNAITVSPANNNQATKRIPFTAGKDFYYSSGTWQDALGNTANDYGLSVAGTGTAGDLFRVRDTYDGYFHPVKIGNRLWMFPSSKYIDIDTWTAHDIINKKSFSSGESYNVKPCTADGEVISDHWHTTEPASPVDGDYWRDGYVLKKYSSLISGWVEVQPYVRVTKGATLGDDFKAGDIVEFSGFDAIYFESNTNVEVVNTKTILSKNVMYVKGLLMSETEANTFTSSAYVKRFLPTMDYVVAHNNRIWGCSSKNHEIYACKLGDIDNWNTYAGIASDSYTATCMPDWMFTGAAEAGNYVVFFTESQIFKVYGTLPSNFTITEITCSGMPHSNAYSSVTIDENLFYVGRDGIYKFTGTMPSKAIDALEGKYIDAKGIAFEGDYIFTAMNEEGRFEMFRVDLENGTFYKIRERNLAITRQGFAVSQDNIWYFSPKAGSSSENTYNYVSEFKDFDSSEEETVVWEVETGELGLSLPDQKYVSKIVIRVDLAEGSTMYVKTSYDDEAYKTELSLSGTSGIKSYTATIVPTRCDHFRLKIGGEGEMHLYSISKVIEQGSETV